MNRIALISIRRIRLSLPLPRKKTSHKDKVRDMDIKNEEQRERSENIFSTFQTEIGFVDLIRKKQQNNIIYSVKKKGENKTTTVEKPSSLFLSQNQGVFCYETFTERYDDLFRPVYQKIDGLGGGWNEKNIENLEVNWDGEYYTLADISEVIVSGTKALVSVAGMTDLVNPILLTCRTNNLVANNKGDLITIKLPPVTTASKKKNIKEAKDALKHFQTTDSKNFFRNEVNTILEKVKQEDEIVGFIELEDVIQWVSQFQLLMMMYHDSQIKNVESILNKREKSMLK